MASELLSFTRNRIWSFPGAADGVTLTSAGSPAWTNGGWFELTSNIGVKDWAIAVVVVRFTPDSQSGFLAFNIDIGVGAAGAEAAVMTIAGYTNFNSQIENGGRYEFAVPRVVVAGSRLSARVRHASTSTTTSPVVAVQYYESPFSASDPGAYYALGTMQTTTATFKVEPNASTPASISSPGTAWVSTAYTTLVASTATARTILGCWLAGGTPNDCEIDLATGAAGAEVIIATYRLTKTGNNAMPWAVMLANPLAGVIGSGVRTAVRARMSSVTSASVSFGVMYAEGATL